MRTGRYLVIEPFPSFLCCVNLHGVDGLGELADAPRAAARPGHHNIVVAMNMTAQPQKIALDLKEAGIQQTAIKTLMTNEPSLMGATSTSITLPPFASWIGEVQMQ